MQKYFLMLVFLIFSGCYINERGISNRFYSDCKEFYDASGTYHKECPENWVDLPLTPKEF
ncbi:hypothetical protein [Campylobacter sp. US33a]|uniref:Lipoprotein n=1 Tax=Campylobacter sp. CCS1377 TaxID=3158229 RepID=A0AAU7EA98_9BACT|nr:hypothetical protein [Campylobacter sp. US33a]MCW1360101.1 hypothetical protein [Campylobacter jejuni]TEY02405.1 hypothetical protein ELQ16_05895 [Campylobacter sp. US33a]